MQKRPLHGGLLRGLHTNPRSSSFEGMFGRMFRTPAKAIHKEADLKALAKAMVAPPEPEQTDENTIDDEENQGIDAGYTYFGQFIDHDLTFDPMSSLVKQNDPDGLTDFRTPRFDLDCVYGRGPDDQPYLYANDDKKMLLGRKLEGNGNEGTRDLIRLNPENSSDTTKSKRALIGDPRNDENVIVSQLQATFIRFHNRLASIMPEKSEFADVQQAVRWHYQWVVLHDFLPTIVGQEVIDKILPHLKSGKSIKEDKPKLSFYHFKNDPYIPVEFSVAAYRFGHSMIRPIYRLNTFLDGRQMIFDFKNHVESLVGFREFPNNWAIDWDLFFDKGNAKTTGKDRIQKSYKIDTSLVDPLGNLPPSIGGFKFPSLAERNLLRGLQMGLPSGQEVAKYMGITAMKEEDIKIGKATVKEFATNPTLVSISENFRNNAPLWCYILAEAQHQSFKNDDTKTFHLGEVGGRIVAEVFIGLLLGDSHSYLTLDPNWKPKTEFLKNKKFGIRQLIDQAMKTD